MGIYEDVIGVSQAVIGQLEDKLGPKNVGVIFGYAAEGTDWPLDNNGAILPVAVVDMPGISDFLYRGGRGIGSVKDDLKTIRFDVLSVAGTSYNAVKVMGYVCDALVGFEPISGGGEINLIGSPMLNPAPQSIKPMRYMVPVGFSLVSGSIVVS